MCTQLSMWEGILCTVPWPLLDERSGRPDVPPHTCTPHSQLPFCIWAVYIISSHCGDGELQDSSHACKMRDEVR